MYVEVPGSEPQFAAFATIVAGDPAVDVAVVHAVQHPDATASLADVPVARLGDSDTVGDLDNITVVGFQSIGQGFRSVTVGQVAARVPDADTPGAHWIEVTATSGFGNSGGAAYDAYGRLIGLPTRVTFDNGGRFGLLRPINEAATVIKSAETEVSPTTVPATTIPATTVPVATSTPPLAFVDAPASGPLQLGHRGERVRVLQEALGGAGYPVDADGFFGVTTRDAVVRFQSDHGLTVDGIAGAQTYATLGLQYS